MLKQQQAQLRTYAGQVAGYEREIERLKAQLDKLKRQLFGQSSEKLRNKLEKKIREAEKQLGEIEDQLNNAKGCLEAAAAITAESDVDGVPEEPADEPTSPRRPSSRPPLPAKPIERSYASTGLLSRILVSKYVEHIPLYHQCEIYAWHGLVLNRNTLVRWVLELADKLSPLAVALNRYVLEAGKVHADDTPVPVQAPGSGRTRTGRLWVYVRDDRNTGSPMSPAVWFAYSPDRKGAHPQRHLAEYRGVLQADAYGGYDALYETGCVTEAACLAHARRKIHDEHARRPTELTTEALRRIAALYAIEADIRGSPEETRLAIRKEKSQPLMQSLYGQIQEQLQTLSVHAEMAKAFDYMLKQWDALNVFFGSNRGGEAAAIIYSLLGTCKLNGVEPEAWLRDVLGKISDWPSNRVHELLPWNLSIVK